MVRDESADLSASSPLDTDYDSQPEPGDEPHADPGGDSSDVEAQSGFAQEDGEGSRASWEKLEEEADAKSGQAVSDVVADNTPDEDGDFEDDDWEEGEGWEEDDDEDDDEEDWDIGEDEDDDVEELPEDLSRDQTASQQHSPAETAEETPSWRVTPIYESGEDVPGTRDQASPDRARITDPQHAASESSISDDETEAEIRKIHQILKDLDEE